MAKSKEWKEKRTRVVADRMEYVRKCIDSIGGYILEENDVCVRFRRGALTITYYPFTGGYTGKGIVSGRGLKNMIYYLKTGNVPTNSGNM